MDSVKKVDFPECINTDIPQEVIVFGAGHYGIMTIYLCRYYGIHVIFCMDNNAAKHGKTLLNGVLCKKPCWEKDIPIIISIKEEMIVKQVISQCKELGYTSIITANHERMEKEYHKLPDKEFSELRYAMRFEGRLPNWDNPLSFNEKLQWLKLYDRRREYTNLVDKYEVKRYISNTIGEEYLIPTLGVWERFEDINFAKLPCQFVLKCTHDSGTVLIVKDKDLLDVNTIKATFEKALNRNFYQESREWPYKDVQPRIIAEEYIVDESGVELKDYKVFVFNGQAKLIQVDFDRFQCHKRNLYTTDWEYIDLMIEYPTEPKRKIEKPSQLSQMLKIAEKISKGMPHVRVDLYSVKDKIYFGEMTFYHGSGMEKFEPEEWNYTLGEWITLPEETIIN